MSNIKDMLIRLRGDNRDLDDKLQKSQQGFSKLQAVVVTANQAFELTGRAIRTIGQGFDALDRGQTITGVSRSFETLNQQAGILADEQLAKLQAATLGTVSSFQLMQQANQAVQLGLDPASLDEMASAATKLGAAVGRDATEAFNDLATGLGRESKLILDNLGILVKSKDNYTELANALGKTTEQLTFQEIAMEEIRRKSEQLSEVTLNAAQESQKLRTTLRDLSDEFLVGLANNDDLAQSFNELNSIVERASLVFGDAEDAFAELLAEFIDGISILGNLGVSFLEFVNQITGIGSATRETQQAYESFSSVLSRRTKEIMQLQGEDLRNAVRGLQSDLVAVNDRWRETAEQMVVVGERTGGVTGAIDEFVELATFGWIPAVSRAGQEYEDLEAISALYQRQADALSRTIAFLTGKLDNNNKATDEASKKTKQLRAEFAKLEADFRLNSLSDALQKSIDKLDALEFSRVRDALAKATEDGLDLALSKYKNVIPPERLESYKQGLIKAQTDAAEEAWQESIKQQWQESADFFSDALYNAMTGAAFDAEDIMKRVLAGVAGGFLSQLTGGLGASFGNLQGLGQQLGGGLLSGGIGSLFPSSNIGPVASGSAYAASLGGSFALPGAAIAATGFLGYEYINSLISGSKPSGLGAAALAPLTGGLSLLGLGDFWGSGKDPDQQRRDSIFNNLAQTGLGPDFQLRGIRGNIDVRRADYNVGSGLGEQSVGLVSGLGSIFGGDETGRNQLTAMFANAVADAENFNEALIQTQTLMQQLGVNAEQAKNELTQLFLDGEIGLEEYQRGMESFNLAAQDNLVGTGSVRDALNVVADATSTNRARLQGLRLTFVELAEIGVDSVTEIRDYFTERFGPDVGDVFAMLAEAGIDFANVTSDQVALIFDALLPILGVLEEGLPTAYKRAEQSAVDFARAAVEGANAAAGALNNIQPGSVPPGTTPLGNGYTVSNNPYRNSIGTGQSRTSLNRNLGING